MEDESAEHDIEFDEWGDIDDGDDWNATRLKYNAIRSRMAAKIQFLRAKINARGDLDEDRIFWIAASYALECEELQSHLNSFRSHLSESLSAFPDDPGSVNATNTKALLGKLQALAASVDERGLRLDDIFNERRKLLAKTGGEGKAMLLDPLRAETIRLYTADEDIWTGTTEAAQSITPDILAMPENINKNGKAILKAGTRKPLEWIREYKKEKARSSKP